METKKQDSAFKNLYFVSSALDLKANRLFKKVLMVKDQIATGTDGYRLHQASVPLADGFYSVLACTKRHIITEKIEDVDVYPSFDECICLDYKYHINTDCIQKKFEDDGAYEIALINKVGIIASIKHIQFIVAYDNFDIAYINEISPIFFSNKSSLKAYVMPMHPLTA